MGELADARADVLTGMCLTNVVFYFIVLATASTLYRTGQHDIETTRQAAAIATGLILDLLGVNPIRMLFLSALVNGLVAPPLLALVMLAANNRKTMGDQTNGLMLNVLGWTTVAVMGAAGLAFALRGGA
jgi:Mn2+/Fe2+ NRAMP family transporter